MRIFKWKCAMFCLFVCSAETSYLSERVYWNKEWCSSCELFNFINIIVHTGRQIRILLEEAVKKETQKKEAEKKEAEEREAKNGN